MKKRRGIFGLLSAALLGVVVVLYGWPSNATYAFTIWPAWVWIVPGLLLATRAKAMRPLLVLLWLCAGFFFEESFRSIPRLLLPQKEANLRVVSLNCAGGDPEAAREVKAYDPDIVLLQESPGREDVKKLATEMFGSKGSFLAGPDASIIARGKLTALPLPKGTINFVAADLQTEDGMDLRIVSLRLNPPTLRFDLWNPQAWRDYARNRANRWQEIADITQALKKMGGDVDLLGGDFNTPPDRALTAPLKPLKDSFWSAGRGYGATAVNPWPLVRIDKIWHGSRLEPVGTRAVTSKVSDHRLVIADFSAR